MSTTDSITNLLFLPFQSRQIIDVRLLTDLVITLDFTCISPWQPCLYVYLFQFIISCRQKDTYVINKTNSELCIRLHVVFLQNNYTEHQI